MGVGSNSESTFVIKRRSNSKQIPVRSVVIVVVIVPPPPFTLVRDYLNSEFMHDYLF